MFDTHCHIHSSVFTLDADEALENAISAGVTGVICVGEELQDSRKAVRFAQTHKGCWASVGVHPHEAEAGVDLVELKKLAASKWVVAIGECGLDYWYENSPREKQLEVFEKQIELALELNLPLIMHIRSSKDSPDDAFDDYAKLMKKHPSARGVVHSFTAGQEQLKRVLSNSHFVGVNGITTFTRDQAQLDALKGFRWKKWCLKQMRPS